MIDPGNLNVGIRHLELAGLIPVKMPHLFESNSYMAGTDDQRAEDFNRALGTEELRAVFCARGGYGVLRLLKRIDWSLIGKDPKPLVGFSDITALQMVLNQKTGLVSFSGPMPAGTQMDLMTAKQNEHYFNLIMNPDYSGIVPGNGHGLRQGSAEGVLLGGNLTMLVHCAAAGLLPGMNGAILLIEDVNEAPYRIDRALTTLKLSGILDNISGVLSGEFPGIHNEESDRILMDCLGDLEVPILSRFPIGHGKQNVALPIGLEIFLDADAGTVRTLTPAVV